MSIAGRVSCGKRVDMACRDPLHRVLFSTRIRLRGGGEDFDPDAAWIALACGALPPGPSVARVAAYHSLAARVHAMETAALGELTRAMSGEPAPEPRPDGSAVVPARAPVAATVIDAVAPALCLGRTAATRRIADAEQLTRALPTVHHLLAGGFIDAGTTAVVLRATAGCSHAIASAVDRSIAHDLIGVTAARARDLVEREIAAQDSTAVTERVAAAVAGRRVEYHRGHDGLGELHLIGPAPAVRALHDTLTTRALNPPPSTSGGGDPYADLTNAPEHQDRDLRGLDAQRFDAALQALNRAPDGSTATPATVEIAVGISTLLGVGTHPGDLAGHGVIPAPIARAWAQRGPLRRFLTDPLTGTVIGVDSHTYPSATIPPLTKTPSNNDGNGEADSNDDGGGGGGRGSPGSGPVVPGDSSHRDAPPAPDPDVPAPAAPCPDTGAGYRIPAGVRRLVTLTQPTCVAPGCSVPANRCDLDHRVFWPAGPTCTCNLAPLCRTHHRMKHQRGWTLHTHPPDDQPADHDADDHAGDQRPHHALDPTLTWTSPTGTTHETVPPRRWPEITPDPRAAPRSSRRRADHRARHPPSESDTGPTGDHH